MIGINKPPITREGGHQDEPYFPVFDINQARANVEARRRENGGRDGAKEQQGPRGRFVERGESEPAGPYNPEWERIKEETMQKIDEAIVSHINDEIQKASSSGKASVSFVTPESDGPKADSTMEEWIQSSLTGIIVKYSYAGMDRELANRHRTPYMYFKDRRTTSVIEPIIAELGNDNLRDRALAFADQHLSQIARGFEAKGYTVTFADGYPGVIETISWGEQPNNPSSSITERLNRILRREKIPHLTQESNRPWEEKEWREMTLAEKIDTIVYAIMGPDESH